VVGVLGTLAGPSPNPFEFCSCVAATALVGGAFEVGLCITCQWGSTLGALTSVGYAFTAFRRGDANNGFLVFLCVAVFGINWGFSVDA